MSSKTAQGVMGGEENEQMGVGQDWVSLCFDVEEEYVGEEDEVLWPHRPKNSMEKRLIQGKGEGKRGRGRPAKTWFQDLKEWTKLDMADASQLVTDRERWCELIRVTAVQNDSAT